MSDAVAGFWAKKTLVVLHGAATHAAALDLESRFTEAALGAVQVADYRNFGHGRHHWIAKHGESTAVLSLVGPGDEPLSRSTLRALPRSILTRELIFAGDNCDVAVASLFASIQLAGLAGSARGIDPGRPGVPAFGSKLYGLVPSRRPLVLDDARRAAIVRKSGTSSLNLEATRKLQTYEKALAQFEHHLGQARFGGLVLDYDGTLRCGPDRNARPAGPAASALARLAMAGLVVGIATGRGDSVVEPLRQLFAKRLWPRILVGYHNGATVATLADAPPSSLAPMAPELAAAKDALEALGSQLPIKLRAHPRQLTIFATSPREEGDFWSCIAEALARADLQGLTVLRSSHSVDVLPRGVSKLRVVEAISTRLKDAAVLCIGDRGRWPGNDYELLATAHSLSVDEVSDDLATGWNLAPPGVRGDAALAWYLERLQRSRGTKSWRFLLK